MKRSALSSVPTKVLALRSSVANALLAFLFVHFMTSTARSQTNQLPEGWSTSKDGPNTIYKPTNLPDGNTFSMTVFPAEDLRGGDLPGWLAQHVEADLHQRGVSARLSPPQRGSSGLVSETLHFQDRRGQD